MLRVFVVLVIAGLLIPVYTYTREYTRVHKAQAAPGINDQINFQGKLVNPDGTNVTDGNYSIVFSIYTVASGGSNVWTETQTVAVSRGIFQVNLGSITDLPGSVDFDTDNIYLGVKVGADAEMAPRIRFTAVPQAFNAERLGGLDKTGFIQNSTSLQSTSNFYIQSNNTTNVTAKFRAVASQTADIIQVRDSGDTSTVFAVSPAGTITAGTWNGSALTDAYVSDTLTSSIFVGSGSTSNAIDLGTAEVAGTLGAANGGTGLVSYTVGDLLYASGTTTLGKLAAVASGSCLISQGVGAAPAWSSCVGAEADTLATVTARGATTSTNVTFNGTLGVTTDVTFTFSGTENLAISSDLDAGVNLIQLVGTPSATAGTTRGLLVQQADSANTNGLDTGIYVNNADTDLAITNAIQIANSGGGGYTNYINAPSFTLDGTGTITAGTWNGTALTDAYVSNTLTASILIGSGSTTNAVDLATAEVAGTLGAANGGTGNTSYAIGDLLYASGATTLSKLAAVASGSCLISQGVGTAPAWGACSTGGGITGSGTNGEVTYFNGTGTVTSSANLLFNGTTLTANALTVTNASTFNGAITANTDADFTFAGTENLTVTSDLAGTVNMIQLTGTPSATSGTARGINIDQANSANTNGLDFGLRINNLDTDLPITAAIQISNNGGGGYTSLLTAPSLFTIDGTGTITLGTWNGTALTDAYVSDTLTASILLGSGSTTNAVDLATAEVAGTLAVGNGGTGITTYTIGDLLYASGTGTLSKLAAVASGSCLISQGVGTAPAWGACSTGGGITGSGTNGEVTYFNGTGTVTSSANLLFNGTTLTANALTVTNTATFNGNLNANSDVTLGLSGTENFTINSDLDAGVNLIQVTGTPSATAGTTRGLFIQQADSANTNGLDTGIYINNADTDLAITNAIQINNTGGGGYTNYISAASFTLNGTGTITAGTWNASTIGVGYGGTGLASYTIGDLLYASGTTTLSKLAAVASGSCLISQGVGTAPAWGACSTGGGITGSGTNGQVTYFNGTGTVTSSANLLFNGTTLTANALSVTNTSAFNGVINANTDINLTFNGTENLAITSDLDGSSNPIDLRVTPSNTAGTNRGLFIQQNLDPTNAATNNLNAGVYINNADDALVIANGIHINNTGGGGYTNLINTPTFTVSGAGAVTGVTTLAASTSVTTPILQNNSADLALQTNTSGNITLTTAAAAGLVNVLTGNLKVGNGTPNVALNGEDAYIEGTLEVDGTVNIGGNVTPDVDDTINLGSSALRWANVWSHSLDVRANLGGNNPVAYFANSNGTDAALRDILHLDFSSEGCNNFTHNDNHFVVFQANSSKIGGVSAKSGANGNCTSGGPHVTYETNGADYAEYFLSDPNNKPGDAELVSFKSGTQSELTERATDTSLPIVGAVSTKAGFVGNGPVCPVDDRVNCTGDYENANSLVGLVGQLKVKVNTSNGAIQVGDPIGLSSTPGTGSKLIGSGYIVGYAMETLDAASGEIMVLIRPSFYTSPLGDTLQGSSLSVVGDAAISGSLSVGDNLNVSGATTLSTLTVTGSITAQGNLTVVGDIETRNITVNGHIVTAGNAPVITIGAAVGQAGTVTVDGNDAAGTVSVTTGSQNTANGVLAHITFAEAFSGGYKVVLSASNDKAGLLRVHTIKTATGFDIVANDATAALTQYDFDYIVLGTAAQ